MENKLSFNPRRLIIAGTRSGVGKTTIALGIMRAFVQKGFKVQPYKVGPDYIDPGYHSQATGVASRNLDSWLVSDERLLELFQRGSREADISIIEGVMGLYDGKGAEEEGSTAHLSKALRAPVILVIDAKSLGRSAAAAILGYQNYDSQVNIAGVIFNRVGSMRHLSILKKSVEELNKRAGKVGEKIDVVGFLPQEESLELPQRHLGLVPVEEKNFANFPRLQELVKENFDLGKIERIASSSFPLSLSKKRIFSVKAKFNYKVKIGIAYDKAFSFYYQDNLDLLESYGGRPIYFSPLEDRSLPEVDGIYFGGGFPEIYAQKLSLNLRMKEEVREAFRKGIPIYAECGGLIYLSQMIVDFQGNSHQMVGVIPATTCMRRKQRALGYIQARVVKDTFLVRKEESVRGHEFHYSHCREAGSSSKERRPVYRIDTEDGLRMDGFSTKNLLASYIHLHFASKPELAARFVAKCAKSGGDLKIS